MYWKFTKEKEMVRKVVREFAEKEIKPYAKVIDETEEFPWENVRKMVQTEMFGIPYPKEYGGAGGDYISYIITVEEISRICASTGVVLSAHTSLVGYPLYQ